MTIKRVKFGESFEKLAIGARSSTQTGARESTTDDGTAYNQKVAMDARSRRIRKDSKSPTTTWSTTAAVVAGAVMPTTASRVGAVSTTDDEEGIIDRKTMIANRSQQKQERFKMQKFRRNKSEMGSTHLVEDDLEAGEDLIVGNPTMVPSTDDGYATPGEDHPEIAIPSSNVYATPDLIVGNPTTIPSLVGPATAGEEDPEIAIPSSNDYATPPVRDPGSDIPGVKLIEAYTVDEMPKDESIFHVAEPVDVSEQRRKLAVGGFFLCLLVIAITVGLTVPLSKRGLGATEMPSVSPSESPSAAPSMSQEPSSAPSNFPTIAPTADFCKLEIPLNVTCTELATGMDCNDYQNQWYENRPVLEGCQSDPIDIEWLYNPATCNMSWAHSGDKIDCSDYNEGPSQEEGMVARVEIASATVPGLVYYNHWIAPFDRFSMSHPSLEPIADILNISIYESERSTSAESLIQSVQVPWDCKSGKSHLFDRYGSLQPVAFTSIEQGHQAAFASYPGGFRMALSFDIQNVGVKSVLLESVTVATDFEPYKIDFTEVISNVEVPPGEIVTPPEIQGMRDMTVDETFASLVTVTGHNEGNVPCTSNLLLNLALDAPGHFHSSPEEPHALVEPNEVCKTKASLHCVGRTVHGPVGCEDILRFPGTYPSRIQFELEERGCTNDESRGANRCNSTYGGVSGGNKNYAVLLQLPGGEVLFDGEVALGENLTLASNYGLGPYLDIVIFSGSYVRERQRVWTSDEGTFIAGQKFGALRLTGIVPSLSERPLASINLHLSIENQGNLTSNVTSAVITTSNPGDIVTELVESPDDILSFSPTVSTRLPFLSVRVDDWMENYKSSISWSAKISGASENGSPCRDSTTIDFSALS